MNKTHNMLIHKLNLLVLLSILSLSIFVAKSALGSNLSEKGGAGGEGYQSETADNMGLKNAKQRMNLPKSLPEKDPVSLWTLQNELLVLAESLVGIRDQNKTIYQPSFHDNGPHIRNTPSFDGAFVELGKNSKVYWPTVVYEMAHETIHLLNPIAGKTNWLEEGVAVDFSILAQNYYHLAVQQPTNGPYFDALQMVRSLPGGTFAAAKLIRSASGSLGAATLDELKKLFPNANSDLLQKLSEKCTPR